MSRYASRLSALVAGLLAAGVLLATGAPPAAGTPPAADGSPSAAPSGQPMVSCDYWLASWQGGFVAELSVRNSGPAINGWVVRFSLDSPTVLGTVWSATMSQPDPHHMIASNVSHNAVIQTGKAISFGWTAQAPSTEIPTDITVNGVAC